jgi:hypothetical protein
VRRRATDFDAVVPNRCESSDRFVETLRVEQPTKASVQGNSLFIVMVVKLESDLQRQHGFGGDGGQDCLIALVQIEGFRKRLLNKSARGPVNLNHVAVGIVKIEGKRDPMIRCHFNRQFPFQH